MIRFERPDAFRLENSAMLSRTKTDVYTCKATRVNNDDIRGPYSSRALNGLAVTLSKWLTSLVKKTNFQPRNSFSSQRHPPITTKEFVNLELYTPQ